MKKLAMTVGVFAFVAVFSMVGSVSADTTVTIENTGPDSTNRVRVRGARGVRRVRVRNINDVRATVETDQKAESGAAVVSRNTEGGDAESGAADNENETKATVEVENNNEDAGSGGGDGGDVDATIENTGPDSRNVIRVGRQGRRARPSRVVNDNYVDIVNKTDQKATSGDATVDKSTTGGDATSGDTSNENMTDVEVDLTNNNEGVGGGHEGGDVDATIDTTGPDSNNVIVVDDNGGGGVNVNNTNTIVVDNVTDQEAESGTSVTSRNTTGGDATSGDASNTNSSEFNFTVENNN